MTAEKAAQTSGRQMEQYLYKDLTYLIRGAFYEVYYRLGFLVNFGGDRLDIRRRIFDVQIEAVPVRGYG